MNYKRLVEMDLKMLWKLTDINPEYNKLINKVLEYKVEDEKDYKRYLEIKEDFIKQQQEIKQVMIVEIWQGKFWSR